jgi:hypothetical protein
MNHDTTPPSVPTPSQKRHGRRLSHVTTRPTPTDRILCVRIDSQHPHCIRCESIPAAPAVIKAPHQPESCTCVLDIPGCSCPCWTSPSPRTASYSPTTPVASPHKPSSPSSTPNTSPRHPASCPSQLDIPGRSHPRCTSPSPRTASYGPTTPVASPHESSSPSSTPNASPRQPASCPKSKPLCFLPRPSRRSSAPTQRSLLIS